VAGIIFLKTKKSTEIRDFYTHIVGMDTWLEQADCFILRHGNLLLGFCSRDTVDSAGIITFFYRSKSEVDAMYTQLSHCARSAPQVNDKYKIYHFFARDPEDRTIEFQSFLHPLKDWPTTDTGGVW
jgi:hypothetical protein